MYCFGVSNHSPDQALHFLQRRKIVAEQSEIAIVPSGTLLSTEKKPSRKFLFILSVSDFYRNLKTLNSVNYANVQLFVFASPLRVAELTHCTPLDFEPHPANEGLGFLLRKDINLADYKLRLKNKEGGTPTVQINKKKYLTLLTDNVKHGSLLNPLMTFLYTLPSSTHQTPVKEAVVDYLYKGDSWAALEQMLDDIKGVIISKRIRDRLKEILQDASGTNIRAAFKEYRAGKKAGKAPLWSSLAKTHSVSEYEMKYLKSVYEAKTSTKPFRGKALGHTPAKKAA